MSDLIVIDGDLTVEILFPARALAEQPAADPDRYGCGKRVVVVLDDGENCADVNFTCSREPHDKGAHVAHGNRDGRLLAVARWGSTAELGAAGTAGAGGSS